MSFQIQIMPSALQELSAIRPFDRRRIMDEIRNQLTDRPNLETRNRKNLTALVPSFEHDAPVWELRVGEYRVFYDIDLTDHRVSVRAVRRKQPGQTTEDIVHD